ncbi:MAG: DNA glycosylase [Chloroflexi bacterium]|nr:DNA glycosylase [Chloroflexota bacterium]
MTTALAAAHVAVDQPLDLPLTLESGQAFRWHNDGGVWSGFIEGRLLTLERDADGLRVTFDPDAHPDAVRAVRDYFRLDDDLPAIYAHLCEDERLSAAVHQHWGLRILRQDPWECLIAFICSQNSNIPRIAKMQETLADTLGESVTLGALTRRAFPTPSALASAGETRLRELGLGYRAKYVAPTAEAVAAGGVDLHALRAVPYEDAKAALVALRGVGEKVADCVLLFALDQLDAAPIDRWVRRALEDWYLDGRRLSYRDLWAWTREAFGPYAGYAQQYLFFRRRETARTKGEAES